MDKNSSFNPISVILGALRIMLNRKVIHLFVLVSCLSFWGCSHRFDRFGFFKPKSKTKAAANNQSGEGHYSLRLIATHLKHDNGVLKEDADNFSTFLLEQLVKDPNFSVELSPDAIQKFDSLANQANPDVIRDLGEKYKVEALVRGRVKDYSYKLGRREFRVSLDLEIEGINTHNSVSFFRFDRKFQRSFRLRGRRQRDMSSYNFRFLNDVMTSIKDSFDEQFEPIVLAQKSRHGGEIPTRPLVDDAGPGPYSQDQMMNVYLWPVSKAGQEKVGPQPLIVKSSTSQLASVASQRSIELRNEVAKGKSKNSLQEPSIDPEQLMLKSAREAEQRLTKSNKLSISRDDSSVNLVERKVNIEVPTETPVEYDSSLDLGIPNFQLVYPEKILANKQYQKLYYLVEDESKDLSALDLENADEEVLELEIFTTFDKTAVKKFLDDYFHGSHPSPRGKIPAVFERYYLGKLQLGFVLGNQAFIASTHRNNRQILDKAMQAFYISNGGITVAKILDTSIKNRRLDKIVFTKKPATEYLPDIEEVNHKVNQSGNRTEVSDIYEQKALARTKGARETEPIESYGVSPVRPEVTPNPSRLSTTNPGALEYEDGNIRNPFDSQGDEISSNGHVPASLESENNLSHNTRITPGYSEDSGKGKQQQVEISSNAGFYFDIGRRYFISNQYELSKRYMDLAHENGFRSEELNNYLSEIQKRLDPMNNSSSGVEVLKAEKLSAPKQYESNDERAGPAVDSGALDFDASFENKNISLGGRDQRNRALEEFYSEMDKMEAELRQYTNNKRQLSTSANGIYKSMSMADLAFQILAIVALVLFFLSFLSSRRITASPIYSDLSKDINKNS